ncbi:TM2 domain-containing protein [bacterium]|nr:TM2 domain-containing protein [bacterium]
MNKILQLLPEAQPEEIAFLDGLLKNKTDDQITSFINIYRIRRKDPQTILILALLGFFFVAGIHRFVLNNIGMGILYVFTGGLCLIGTIVDLVNYRSLTNEYNLEVARGIAPMI